MQDSVTVHRQLDHFVTEHLRTAVLDGHLEPGEWLRQQESPSISTYTLLNHHFHQIIYTTSWCDYLIRALDQIWSAFPAMMLSYFAQTTLQELTEQEERGAMANYWPSGDTFQEI